MKTFEIQFKLELVAHDRDDAANRFHYMFPGVDGEIVEIDDITDIVEKDRQYDESR